MAQNAGTLQKARSLLANAQGLISRSQFLMEEPSLPDTTRGIAHGRTSRDISGLLPSCQMAGGCCGKDFPCGEVEKRGIRFVCVCRSGMSGTADQA